MDNQILEHLMNPKNYGPLDDKDGEGIGKNPTNGEKVAIYFKLEDDKIKNIKFQAIGCSTTIVTGSIFTESAKNQTLQELENMYKYLLKSVEKLPPEEAACSEMVAIATKAAIDTYNKRKMDKDYPTITYFIEKSCEVENE